MRVKGSCKFSTYYRLQAWNDRLCVWQPIRTYPSLPLAEKAMKPGKKYRLWEISMDQEPTLIQEV